MKIGLLTRYDMNNGSTRVRAMQYVPHFEAVGNRVRVLRRENRAGAWPRLSYTARMLDIARWADVLFLQKPNFAPRLIDLLRVVNPRIVVDIDDAVWCTPASRKAPQAKLVSERFAERLRYAVRRGGNAVAGNSHIASWLQKQCPAAAIKTIPPSVDLDIYREAKEHRNSGAPVTVGWIGSSGNLGDLQHVRSPLGAMIQEGSVKLRVICNVPPKTGPPCEFVPWDLGSEVASLLACDVGIMPLGKDERSLGRCGYKAIQFMALGIPVVASNVGAGHDFIEHGVNGYLAANDDEWRARLGELSRDPELRTAMGAAARERVRAHYSVQGNIPLLLDLLYRVGGNKGSRDGFRNGA